MTPDKKNNTRRFMHQRPGPGQRVCFDPTARAGEAVRLGADGRAAHCPPLKNPSLAERA